MPKQNQTERTTPIGEFIRQNRRSRGLSQTQLAEYAEVSYTLLNRLENGDSSAQVTKVNKILAVFGHQLGPTPIPERKLKDPEPLQNRD